MVASNTVTPPSGFATGARRGAGGYTSKRLTGKATLSLQGEFLWERLEETGVQSDQLQSAVDAYRERSASHAFSEIVVELGYATERQVAEWIAKFLKVDYVEAAALANPEADVTRLLDGSVARQRGALPLRREAGMVIVAVHDPEVPQFAQVKHALGTQPFRFVIAAHGDVMQAVEETYTEKVHAETEDDFAHLIEELYREAAMTRGLSDIHFCPEERNTEIRFRIDGKLITRKVVDASKSGRLISAIKVSAQRMEDGKTLVSSGYLGGLEVAKNHIPQDANAVRRYGAKRFSLRFSLIPSINGESVVIRFLDLDAQVGSLDKLGMLPDHAKVYKRIIQMPNGLVVNCGPTSHGKSTTLAAAVQYMDTRGNRIISVEDPVEYRLRGVTQIQVYPHIKEMSFEAVLKALVRHNPNILLLGEMRDHVSTGIGIEFSNTGHLVFSTTHANGASAGYLRLLELEAAPVLVSATVRLMLGQRLVRRLCERCRQPHEKRTELKKEWLPVIEKAHNAGLLDDVLKENRPIDFWEAGSGCPHCNRTGYRGRIAIFEIRLPKPEILAMLKAKTFSEADAEKLYAQDFERGDALGRTMLQDGIIKAARGETSYEEVMIATSIQI